MKTYGSLFAHLRRGSLLGLLAASALHAAPPAAVTSFYVSPTGNDSNAGTKAAPFKTLDRARDAATAISSTQKKDITIFLRGGTYRLTDTFELTPEDSGQNGHDIVYKAAPGETPVISGSVLVQNWELFDAAKGIWRANVGSLQTRQLYVNGVRAIRARTPELPVGFRPVHNHGIEFIPTVMNPAGWRDPSTWTNIDKVEAVNYTQWKMTRVGVASLTPYPTFDAGGGLMTGLLVMKEPAWKNSNIFLDRETHQPGDISFWQVSWFENAYEFLDEVREWYLNETTGYLYYKPHWTENLAKVPVELPIVEFLVSGHGDVDHPVTNIRFEGITFNYATWLSPSTDEGYVTDQSGFHLIGPDHPTNDIDHDPNDVRTPGNVGFSYAHNITFTGNIFEHLGAVALDFGTGSQDNVIQDNLFEDISSAAIQLGGVDIVDHHPEFPEEITRDNLVTNNFIYKTGREFYDSAGIFAGFTTNTTMSYNTIRDVPWSAIALGWGWGLLDPGGFPGAPGADVYQWGVYNTPTTNKGGKILNNRMYNYLETLWDAGAVYTTGAQGSSSADALLLSGNVATNKRPKGGGNIFYTDGGTRHVVLRGNVSIDNAQGVADYGPPPRVGDPLPYNAQYSLLTGFPYGTDIGGCRTYGDIAYEGNYWMSAAIGVVCPFTLDDVAYPVRISYKNNKIIRTRSQVPKSLFTAAGVRKRPATIPAARWAPSKVD